MADDLTLIEISAADINSNFNAIKTANGGRAKVNGDSTQTFNVANATASTHAANKGQLDAAITALEADVAALETDVTALESSVATVNTEISSINSELATKANTTDVNNALAAKANTTDMNAALALKADLNGSVSQTFSVADATVATQAVSKGQLDSAVSVIDSGISALEGDVTALEGSVATINTEISSMNSEIDTKADTTYVDSQLATKANTTDVNTALAAKANTTDMNAALALKADLNGSISQTFSVADATVATQAVSKGQLDSAVSGLDSDISALESTVDSINEDIVAMGEEIELIGNSPLFCMHSGNLDANGEADVLGYSGTTLSFKVGGSYDNLVATYADKSLETLTSLSDITGLSTDGTYAVVKEKETNPIALNTTLLKSVGTAISSGDFTGYPKENAFDGLMYSSNSTGWYSSQQGSSINGVAYIGKGFGSEQTINSLIVAQVSCSTQFQTSVRLQTSTNGSTWTDVEIFSNLVVGVNVLTLSTPLTTSYFRLLANSAGTTGYSWGVINCEIIGDTNSVTRGKTFPNLPSDGDYHCLTATGLQTYKRVSGAWVETQYVRIGTVTVSGGAITAVTTNPYNQNGYDVNVYTSRKYNYANPVTKSAGVLYTAESDGLVCAAGGWTSTDCHVTIDGVSYPIHISSSQGSQAGGQYPVAKGQTYIFSAGSLFRFIPLVTV